ncbi:MAG: AmmeMemoRadiSam system protein B [Omnitrophica bacterium]|nr:AmmeMemoRadiSam system protein B [Candidatus Omnitrophota bacterium]
MIRKPAVAGRFYTANEGSLKKQLADFTAQKEKKIEALGVVSPHAGYVYSGGVAGRVLSSIAPKPTYVILGTNHTGAGKPFGLDAERAWKTPLGEVTVDSELAEAILKDSRYIEKDFLCHDGEHSIEVQLPFLQFLNKNFTFVPIEISQASGQAYKDIGRGLARAQKKLKKDIVIIASSDMTHYEPHREAEKKDMLAIEKILALDIDGFLGTVEKYNISMCGTAPTAVMLASVIELGATKAKLIKYATSAEASGDYSAVVGYAGIVVY